MTIRQKIFKWAYPILMQWQHVAATEKKIIANEKNVVPPVSFFALHATLNNGDLFEFSKLKGKKVLIVNVASGCGYTGQYSELEELYNRYKDKLAVLGFPANDFKEQEPGSDEEIAAFCKINFGVSFPLFKKHSVMKGSQNEVYEWLTSAGENGWNTIQPTWNFCKYLIDENGKLTHFIREFVSPLSKEVLTAIDT